MGGFGSGRDGGRPLADSSLRVDIGWMLRTGHARDGAITHASLHWQHGGEPAGSISYTADMRDPESATLELNYTRGQGASAESVHQTICLCHTRPTYGGRRWWMICPYRGHRVLKLYLPAGGDRFASRKAWQLAYQSQRISARDWPFEAMFRIQQKLGGEPGYDAGLPARPKGMWNRTYDRLHARFNSLEDHCTTEMNGLMSMLEAR